MKNKILFLLFTLFLTNCVSTTKSELDVELLTVVECNGALNILNELITDTDITSEQLNWISIKIDSIKKVQIKAKNDFHGKYR